MAAMRKKAQNRAQGCKQRDRQLEAGAVLVNQARQKQQADRERPPQALEKAEKTPVPFR